MIKNNIMQKSNLTVLVFVLIFLAQNASASVLMGLSCFVTAEVTDIDYENHYLNLEILNVDKENGCPVQENQVYRAIDNYYASDGYPASFKKGDKINAGIEVGSSMSPSGAVSFLHWSDVTYENGASIKYKLGTVTDLQSDTKPLNIEKINDSEQGNLIEKKYDDEDNNFNYLYFVIPPLILVGFLLYRFLYKRSAP